MDRKAAPLRPRAPLDTLSVRERNSRSGTSGAEDRASTAMKPASNATPPARAPMTWAEPQPASLAPDHAEHHGEQTEGAQQRAGGVEGSRPVWPCRVSGTNVGMMATTAITMG